MNGMGISLRAGGTGGDEGFQHVEVLEAHLGDDDRGGEDARGSEGGAESCARGDGSQRRGRRHGLSE